MARSWKDSETSYLKRYASTKTLEELAQRFMTDNETVAAKLSELSLSAKDGLHAGGAADPALLAYEEGLRHLFAKEWEAASDSFEKVLTASDQLELTDRARQFLATCRAHREEDDGGFDDPFLEAVYRKNRGDLDAAYAICEKGGRLDKDERFAYLAASIHALAGRLDEAERTLQVAIGLNPRNRVHAHHDPDFSNLRQKQEYAHLFTAP